MSSIHVRPDSLGIADLMSSLQSSSNGLTNNPIVQLLAGGDQNTVGQVLTSISQQFNQMNNRSIENAVSSKKELILRRQDKTSFFSRWCSSS